MTIKDAREEIIRSVKAYLDRDDMGRFRIPVIRQRPLLLMGPPGIGKTQIMEQAARECGVALVSYTITHHTRQSAVGLPFIVNRNYNGQDYSVTEYTMSEIIASIYEKMEATGLREGILFIDEINCVSETLAPTMLQFLQNKTFGNQRVPEGWVITAAGNPPEYNRSVREFDVVTLDRVRKIDVEPDFDAWKEYAYRQSLHGAVVSYLDLRRENFYRIETTPDGVLFATARGWEDLSGMLLACEGQGLPVDGSLIGQYIQFPRIAKDFANYYELYNKYRGDYRIDDILAGHFSQQAVDRLGRAAFDERLGVLGLLLSALGGRFKQAALTDSYLERRYDALKAWKAALSGEASEPPEVSLRALAQREADELARRIAAGQAGADDEAAARRAVHALEQDAAALREADVQEPQAAFELVKARFETETAQRKADIAATSEALEHVFAFLRAAFGEGQEMVVFVTELTVNYYSAKFIMEHGSDAYYGYNRSLLFDERQKAILDRLDGERTPT